MPLLGAGGLAGKEQGKGVVQWEKFFLQFFFFLFQCALRADTQTRAPRDRVTLPVSQNGLTVERDSSSNKFVCLLCAITQ